MATVNNTRQEGGGRTHRHVWTPLLQGDEGEQATIPGGSDRVAQVYGTFGGASVTLEGSLLQSPNAATADHWFPITDLQGNAVTFTSAGGEYCTENVTHVRPQVTGGDGTTSLTVVVLSRSTMR